MHNTIIIFLIIRLITTIFYILFAYSSISIAIKYNTVIPGNDGTVFTVYYVSTVVAHNTIVLYMTQ